MIAALGDHQVTTLGAHIMARAVGAKHLDTGVGEVWGLESSAGRTDAAPTSSTTTACPWTRSATCPRPPATTRTATSASCPRPPQQVDEFFRTGVVVNHCEDGVCSFPELSGCP